MGSFFTNPQGRPDDCGNRVLRRRITFNTTSFNTAAGLPIGAIEKGGVLLRAYAIKNTAFSAGATLSLGNVANVGSGQTANVASVMSTADAAATTAGPSASTTEPYIGLEMPADTVIYAYLAGTPATAGDVTFIVEYTPAYPWSDLNGGQAT